eukprot:1153372-Pleurochrysis_carterae.AAC.2
MAAEWRPMELELAPYKESGTHVLKSMDETLQMLDDHLVKTQATPSLRSHTHGPLCSETLWSHVRNATRRYLERFAACQGLRARPRSPSEGARARAWSVSCRARACA